MAITLVSGGRIYTPDHPRADGMVVHGDRIVYAGSAEDAAAAAGSLGRDAGPVHRVDLAGELVTPAFVDAHVHSTATGLMLGGLDLSTVGSAGELTGAVAAYVRDNPEPGPVLGHGWDETLWPDRRLPVRADLDRVAPGRVVYLSRVDVHAALVSSALLDAAPEVRGLPGYAGSGHLTGLAHGAAHAAAARMVTAPIRRSAQLATLGRAAALGIGTVHELGGPEISSAEDLRHILALAAAEPVPEVIGYWGELGGAARARELGAAGAAGDLFADGTVGSHTACLRMVYADAPHTGTAYLTAAEIGEHVAACAGAGLQAGFHAIGDGAMDSVIAGFEEAARRVGADLIRAGRHRVEHVEMVDADLITRMARLGIHASVQPAFDALWGGPDGMYAERLGRDRALTMNPLADLAAAGIPLAFGSDSPVTALDPWGTVRAAVYHHVERLRLTPAAAFAAHTVGGHRAARDDAGGTLTAGAPASYAIWREPDRSGGRTPAGLPELAPGRALPECLRTVVRGRTIFDRL